MISHITFSMDCLHHFLKLIHQNEQRKSQPGRRFRYAVLISSDFDDFTSPFSP